MSVPSCPLVERCEQRAPTTARATVHGEVTRAVGLGLIARGVVGEVGDVCWVRASHGEVPATILGFDGDTTTLQPLDRLQGLSSRAPVRCTRRPWTVPVGAPTLGRVLDGLGRPLDQGPALDAGPRRDLRPRIPPALERRPIDLPLRTGVRALDLLHPIGRGQRLGIFAGAGVGKTTLLGSLLRHAEADVIVLALIGERGREVRSFLDQHLHDETRPRSVVVVATSESPAQQRISAAHTAATVAESFRDEGADVLVVMDSATRFAMAVREAGLAAGEIPTQRGYPPSLFAELPGLVERFGTAATGSITAVLNVLVEGDDLEDPVADSLRGLLDGHWVLSRRLAERGHHPALDLLASLSRLAPALQGPEERSDAATVRGWLSRYEEARDLIELGAWQRGRDPALDRIVDLKPRLDALLRQDPGERADHEEARKALHRLVRQGAAS